MVSESGSVPEDSLAHMQGAVSKHICRNLSGREKEKVQQQQGLSSKTGLRLESAHQEPSARLVACPHCHLTCGYGYSVTVLDCADSDSSSNLLNFVNYNYKKERIV